MWPVFLIFGGVLLATVLAVNYLDQFRDSGD